MRHPGCDSGVLFCEEGTERSHPRSRAEPSSGQGEHFQRLGQEYQQDPSGLESQAAQGLFLRQRFLLVCVSMSLFTLRNFGPGSASESMVSGLGDHRVLQLWLLPTPSRHQHIDSSLKQPWRHSVLFQFCLYLWFWVLCGALNSSFEIGPGGSALKGPLYNEPFVPGLHCLPGFWHFQRWQPPARVSGSLMFKLSWVMAGFCCAG
jgi:hypothetical protein